MRAYALEDSEISCMLVFPVLNAPNAKRAVEHLQSEPCWKFVTAPTFQHMEKRSHLGICTDPFIILEGIKLIPEPSPQEQQQKRQPKKKRKCRNSSSLKTSQIESVSNP